MAGVEVDKVETEKSESKKSKLPMNSPKQI